MEENLIRCFSKEDMQMAFLNQDSSYEPAYHRKVGGRLIFHLSLKDGM